MVFMKYLFSFLLILVELHSATFANDHVPFAVYGKDDRTDLYAVKNPLVLNAAKSIAAMVSINRIDKGVLSGVPFHQKVCK